MDKAEMEERLARQKRIRFLKKVIIFVLVMAILIPTALSVILGVQLHIVKKELKELREQAVETAVMYPVEALEETDADAEGGEDTDLYTADGVNVSRRDNAKTPGDNTAAQPAEDGSVRQVYLTFDDGPSSNTNRILDILAQYDVKATFFVVGKEEEEYQALYKRIVEEGHTLAMHSYSHKYDEIYESVESYAADLSKLQEFLYETTGVWCRYCRFPGGSSNTVSRVDMHELIAYLDEQDITYFDWNVSSGDASNSYISTDAILRNCMSNLAQYHESIILMHDASNKNTTVEALPTLIERIQAMEDTVIVPITEDTEPIQHISND
ncbi:MAG: polysaccharide deacetylase [Clostridium sp.]|nr:polysaccharide deacetylase [Clostridium sp.]